MKYWLMKSEPSEFSVDDFKKAHKTLWTGVRNYQARNFMANEMALEDKVLFYHSSCETPGIMALAKVSKVAQPDPLQFEKKSDYYDPKSTHQKPIWYCVEVEFLNLFRKPLPLSEIKIVPQLKNMLVLKKGSRLSIQPVQKEDFNFIIKNYL